MGDFNDMASQDEKFGGNPICRRHIQAYTECMDYFGPKYTWTNVRGVTNLIQERLDRGWANSNWKIFSLKLPFNTCLV